MSALRVVHIVGPFDGVVLRSIVAPSLESAKARAVAYGHEFAAAQNANRTELGTGIAIALDFYIARDDWPANEAARWSRYWYRWAPRAKYAAEPTWTLVEDLIPVDVLGWPV